MGGKEHSLQNCMVSSLQKEVPSDDFIRSPKSISQIGSGWMWGWVHYYVFFTSEVEEGF